MIMRCVCKLHCCLTGDYANNCHLFVNVCSTENFVCLSISPSVWVHSLCVYFSLHFNCFTTCDFSFLPSSHLDCLSFSLIPLSSIAVSSDTLFFISINCNAHSIARKKLWFLCKSCYRVTEDIVSYTNVRTKNSKKKKAEEEENET